MSGSCFVLRVPFVGAAPNRQLPTELSPPASRYVSRDSWTAWVPKANRSILEAQNMHLWTNFYFWTCFMAPLVGVVALAVNAGRIPPWALTVGCLGMQIVMACGIGLVLGMEGFVRIRLARVCDEADFEGVRKMQLALPRQDWGWTWKWAPDQALSWLELEIGPADNGPEPGPEPEKKHETV